MKILQNLKKIKNLQRKIIVGLIPVYALNLFDGWAVHGIARFLLSLILVALIVKMLTEYEKVGGK